MINLNNCRVAITGHTRGIGQAFAQLFNDHGADVTGYSLSTGYDIGDCSVVKKILGETKNFNIFINNAYHPTGQYNILEGLINQWKGTNKLIVNIGSTIVYDNDKSVDDYIIAKQAQLHLTRSTLIDSGSCNARNLNNARILNVIPGIVDTKMSNLDKTDFKTNPDDLAKIVIDIIRHMDTVTIKEIIIDPPRPNSTLFY
jgi:NADP-dependent 3-hydroxy acid dehydrogenase YdfG